MRPIIRVPLLALLAAGSFIALQPSGSAAETVRRHTRLLRSVPAKDTVITTSPAAIELYFNEAIALPVSRVRLLRVGGDSVVLGALRRDEQMAKAPVTASLRTPLTAGQYRVHWSTASKDGHVVRDSFDFSMRAP